MFSAVKWLAALLTGSRWKTNLKQFGITGNAAGDFAVAGVRVALVLGWGFV